MFRYCLNPSTIQGQKLTLPQQAQVASQAGYQGIEPWLRDIEAHLQSGGSLADLKNQFTDLGLAVENAIGFAKWIVDDPAERAKGLEQLKHDMDLVARIGGRRIAAPPIGATEQADLDLLAAAERYRAILDLGEQMGVTPMVEIWGFSKTLSRLGQAALVAVEAAHPSACILADVYHLYKGGSDPAGLRLLSQRLLPVLHMNDYPATPSRADIQDHHRVHPTDGTAPLSAILRDLAAVNPDCVLSLELFNRDYRKQAPLTVARTGLEKMQSAVRQAIG